jgi:hypothetical protein
MEGLGSSPTTSSVVPSSTPTDWDSSAPLAFDPTYADDFMETQTVTWAPRTHRSAQRVRAELAEAGDTLADRWNIANRFYYRYQVPERQRGVDRIRSVPQRGRLTDLSAATREGPGFALRLRQHRLDGSVNGKVIAVGNLYDTDALPLHTDWYRKRVEEGGLGDAAADTYRVYFNDHADHQDAPVAGERAKHLVTGTAWSSSAPRRCGWAEEGVTPPESTRYEVVESQIVVPDNAAHVAESSRRSDLTDPWQGDRLGQGRRDSHAQGEGEGASGNRQDREAEWDLDGDGVYTDAGLTRTGSVVELKLTAAFVQRGTYLVALRVTSERTRRPTAQFALSQNLDRIQVVVTSAASFRVSRLYHCAALLGGLGGNMSTRMASSPTTTTAATLTAWFSWPLAAFAVSGRAGDHWLSSARGRQLQRRGHRHEVPGGR